MISAVRKPPAEFRADSLSHLRVGIHTGDTFLVVLACTAIVIGWHWAIARWAWPQQLKRWQPWEPSLGWLLPALIGGTLLLLNFFGPIRW